MRFGALRLLAPGLLGWGCALICCGAVAGQDEPPATPAAPATAPSPAKAPIAGPLQPAGLDTYMLRDSKGNLVPVPDWTYEEFEQLLRIKRGLAPPPPPPYTLDVVAATGTVERGAASLEVTATVRVREAGWVRVPLAMGRAILRGEVKHQGPGEHFITFDDAAGGYVAWLSGADAKPHVLTAQLTVPVEQAGDASRLGLAFPRATQSTLRLTVPVIRAEATLSAGDGLVSTSPKGERTEIEVLSPAGEVQLTWRKGQATAVPGPALLEASGEIAVKVEGENRVSSDARLRVRSFSGELATFRVELPPGMELQPSGHVGYSVTLLSSPTLPASSADKQQPVSKPGSPQQSPPQVVEVQLDRPTAAVAEVRLLATSSAAHAGSLAAGRFNVVGAARQRGTLDCTVEGEWLLQWKEDASVRRLNLPADAPAKLVARYEYVRQPCGLSLSVSTRPSRVTVEPLHVVYVDAQRLRVESTLKYRFRGSRAPGVTFEMGSWALDRLAPAEHFDLPPAGPGPSGRLTIPLRTTSAVPTELEVKFEAHQSFDPLTESIAFSLPRPVADVVTPATVLVVAADNVELTPQAELISGLAADWSPTTLRIPTRQQTPLAYRDLGGGEPASFAAGFRVRPQSITASARAIVRAEGQQLLIEQQLNYRIAHVPARQFQILVPRSVLSAGPWEVWLGNESLSPTPVVDALAGGEAAPYQLVAPADQIGHCQFVVKYALPLPKWVRGKTGSLALPLVIPADAPNQQLGGQQVELFIPDAWQLEADSSGTSEFSRPTPAPSAGPGRMYSWSRVTPVTRWNVQSAQSALATDVAVTKAWIQTWLGGGLRQERASFRVLTDRDQLRLVLPKDFQRSSLQAAVNAQPVAVAIREPSTALVSLPPAARGREAVVELWYTAAAPSSQAGIQHGALGLPVVEDATPPRRLYWQLCLPDDQHLLATPRDLASEMAWGRHAWLWRRQPTLSQDALEAWIGASRQDPVPRGANQYLFSSLGRAPHLDVWIAGQRLLLLMASGLVLGLGLLLLHVRAVRRPEALLVAAIVLAALALAWPDAALLLAQAAAVGLAVALLSAGWLWLTSGRTMFSPAPIAAPQADPQSRSTEAPVRTPRNAGLTTATAPAAMTAEPLP